MVVKKPYIIFTFVLVLVFGACACSEEKAENLKSVNEYKTLMREDEEGEIQVHINEGKATLKLTDKYWKGYSEGGGGQYNEIPTENVYPIEGLSVNVKDVTIGEVPLLTRYTGYEGLKTKSIFFLMEDGHVEWTILPYYWPLGCLACQQGEVLNSIGKLPWIKDIVSLSYEQGQEGIGEMTVFAESSSAQRYDLSLICRLQDLFHITWKCELQEDGYYAFLKFEENGEVSLKKGRSEEDLLESYRGNYEISINEAAEDGKRTGIVSFDFWKEGKENITERKPDIQGSYFIDRDEYNYLTLWKSEGDALHTWEAEEKQEYSFMNASKEFSQLDVRELSEEEFMEYFLSVFPRKEELINKLGMSILVTGENSEIVGVGIGRDISLGTNTNKSFVREFHYSVTPSGEIYEYNTLEDKWELIELCVEEGSVK